MTKGLPFWQRKTLHDMSQEEWESLCDGCGQCCLHKIRHPSGRLEKTSVACRLLDTQTARCGNYPKRKRLVRDCVVLTPDTVKQIDWLPATCAYRLLADGQDLPAWHPLVTGDPESVHRAGISVRGRCTSERDAGALTDYVIK